MMDPILQKVRAISADVFQVPVKEIRANTSPETLESWDSVQHLNLVLALEQEFGVQFEPEDMGKMQNIGAVAELVESKLP